MCELLANPFNSFINSHFNQNHKSEPNGGATGEDREICGISSLVTMALCHFTPCPYLGSLLLSFKGQGGDWKSICVFFAWEVMGDFFVWLYKKTTVVVSLVPSSTIYPVICMVFLGNVLYLIVWSVVLKNLCLKGYVALPLSITPQFQQQLAHDCLYRIPCTVLSKEVKIISFIAMANCLHDTVRPPSSPFRCKMSHSETRLRHNQKFDIRFFITFKHW